MYQFNSILKMLVLALAVSFFVSCSDDNDDSNVIIPGGGGNTDPTGTIEASELVVTGTLKQFDVMSTNDFNDWDSGQCSMVAYMGVNLPEYKVGEGTVQADGSYSMTLQKSIKKEHISTLAISLNNLDVSPADLSKTIAGIYFYAVVNGVETRIHMDAPEGNEENRSIEYYYNFYSADGHISGTATNLSGEEVIGIYDVNCKKGWNLISSNNITKKIQNEAALPSTATAYIYKF